MEDGEAVHDRIIDRHGLREIVPLHPTHLARLEAAGEFPRRVRLGKARIGWSLFEILDWIEERKAARNE